MKLNWAHWAYTLTRTVIGGVAASVTTWLSTLIGNQIDANVQVLQLNQLWYVLGVSFLFNLFFFLKQSPLPDDTENK